MLMQNVVLLHRMWAGFSFGSERHGVDYDGVLLSVKKCSMGCAMMVQNIESTRMMWAGFLYGSGLRGVDGDGVWLWKSNAGWDRCNVGDRLY